LAPLAVRDDDVRARLAGSRPAPYHRLIPEDRECGAFDGVLLLRDAVAPR
jgi:hypothetical protein